MSRPGLALRDAAVGYASRGIPVLPLHYPVATRPGARLVPADWSGRPGWQGGCSCGDPGCGQVGKHPLGALVPHGLWEATTNRARVLAWWTHYPLANIGLVCGHLFDVLDLDGPMPSPPCAPSPTSTRSTSRLGGRWCDPAGPRPAGTITWPRPA